MMKAFFLSRQLREKALLVLFLVAAALIWLSSIVTRGGIFIRGVRDTSDDLRMQRSVLARRSAVDARVKASTEQLDPSNTFEVLRLQGELENLARQNGINNSRSSDPQSTSSGRFAVNTVQLIIPSVDYKRLVDFYAALSKKAPYIGIEQILIRPAPGSQGPVQASLKVSSVEINSGAR